MSQGQIEIIVKIQTVKSSTMSVKSKEYQWETCYNRKKCENKRYINFYVWLLYINVIEKIGQTVRKN